MVTRLKRGERTVEQESGAVLDAVDSWSEFAVEASVGPRAKEEVGCDIRAMSASLR
jgi:hypothetical protein